MKCWLFAVLVFAVGQALAASTLRPIVGILTQPTDGKMTQFGQSYIAASYVKFLESAGARVVPVLYPSHFSRNSLEHSLTDESHNSTTAELDDIFASINGILFPGGGSDLDNTPLYKSGLYLYQKALKAFDNGDYFPIFGHCQGFELLAIITSRDFDILSRVDAENLTLPLNFTDEAATSRWLGSAPQTVLNILSTEPVTMNNHVECVSPEDFQENEYLPMFYNVLSTNYDRNGKEFISMWEGNKYPIYGAQWHAEKPQFEWNPQEVINHSPDSIFAMQYFANFMGKNSSLSMEIDTHRFQNEYNSLIYNYSPYYTEDLVHDFEQIYAF